MIRSKTLVWGYVVSNGKHFFLLDPAPAVKFIPWKLEGTLQWQVAEKGTQVAKNVGDAENPDIQDVYVASHIIFGKESLIKLVDDPNMEIYVEYYSDEE